LTSVFVYGIILIEANEKTKTKSVEQEGVSKMRIIESGKYKNRILAECPVSYLKWLVTHTKVLAERNRWLARDAKFLLERIAQAAIEAATIEKVEEAAGNANWDEWAESLKEFEARKEAEMAVKIAEHLVSTPVKVDLGLKGNLSGNKAFSLLR
jgi:hypothetical protein